MTKNILMLLLGAVITLVITAGTTASNKPQLHNEEIPEVLLRSYQLQLINENDAVIYDGYRYVGTISYSTKSQLGKVIYSDNR